MTKWPRYRVRALRLLEERYEADGWLEIRTRAPDLRTWESRCNVLSWNHRELTGSMPIDVRLELAAGGEVSGNAYVDQSFHLSRGGGADLKIHGTGQGVKVRGLGPADYRVPRKEAVRQVLLAPMRVLIVLLVTAAAISVAVLFFVLAFGPIGRPAF